jgi:hypothetical protein
MTCLRCDAMKQRLIVCFTESKQQKTEIDDLKNVVIETMRNTIQRLVDDKKNLEKKQEQDTKKNRESISEGVDVLKNLVADLQAEKLAAETQLELTLQELGEHSKALKTHALKIKKLEANAIKRSMKQLTRECQTEAVQVHVQGCQTNAGDVRERESQTETAAATDKACQASGLVLTKVILSV